MEKKKSKQRNFVVSALFALIIVIPFTHLIAPGHIPFSAADIWSFHGTGLSDWMRVGWPMFAWGFGLTLLLQLLRPTVLKTSRTAAVAGGVLLSMWAGIAEELAFRWLIFLASFTYVAISNWLFFGFLGFGIPELIFTYILGPVANFVTFGYLAPQLTGASWLLGAAMLSANAFFRDGHKYLGPVGIVNSWFLGMYLFYIALNQGLLAAILVHFAYDVIVFTTGALTARRHRYAWEL